MVWGEIRGIYDGFSEYHGYCGRLWIMIMFTFRLFSIASVGNAVYGDDHSAFRCDTQQPGCQTICFNYFSPISHGKGLKTLDKKLLIYL